MKYEQRRSIYVAKVLGGCSKKAARQAAGLGKNAPSRIQKRMEEGYGIHDRPRSGRPRVYTEDMLARCFEVLKEQPTRHIHAKLYFNILQDRGLVHRQADRRRFTQRLVEWCIKHGHSIDMKSTKEEFFIAEMDKPKRKEYATMLKGLLADDPDTHFVFIDETSVEFGEHPKKGELFLYMLDQAPQCTHNEEALQQCNTHNNT